MNNKRFILKRSNTISLNYRLGERVYDTVLKKELYNLEIVDLLNEQQARVEMLEKGILDCLFNNKSIGVLAEEMGLVE